MRMLLAAALVLGATQAGAQQAKPAESYYDAATKILEQDERAEREKELARLGANGQAILEQRLEAGIQNYLKCALLAGSLLDDGVSDAATIALGARSQCYTYLEALAKEPTGKNAEGWGDLLHPGVVNKILAHRVALKLDRSKPPPRANKQQM